VSAKIPQRLWSEVDLESLDAPVEAPQDDISTREATTYVLRFLATYNERAVADEELHDEFAQDFAGWTVGMFHRAHPDFTRAMKGVLRAKGIYTGPRNMPPPEALFGLLDLDIERVWPQSLFLSMKFDERSAAHDLQALARANTQRGNTPTLPPSSHLQPSPRPQPRANPPEIRMSTPNQEASQMPGFGPQISRGQRQDTPLTYPQPPRESVPPTAGPNGLASTLLMDGAYPRMVMESTPSPATVQRSRAIDSAMKELRKLSAKRQVNRAMAERNGPSTEDVMALSIGSEVLVWRQKNRWQGSYKILSVQTNDVSVDMVNGPRIRSTAVKLYHRVDAPKHTDTHCPQQERVISAAPNSPPRRRGRPPERSWPACRASWKQSIPRGHNVTWSSARAQCTLLPFASRRHPSTSPPLRQRRTLRAYLASIC
jgi:hypothetical protein